MSFWRSGGHISKALGVANDENFVKMTDWYYWLPVPKKKKQHQVSQDRWALIQKVLSGDGTTMLCDLQNVTYISVQGHGKQIGLNVSVPYPHYRPSI